MPCTHKFFGHPEHLEGEMGLLPNWNVRTLFVGTFNPEDHWHPTNAAKYYYGRGRNYFWKILPLFAGELPISNGNTNAQIDFLRRKGIGITDLLVRIEDAESNNAEHLKSVRTVLDSEIERFDRFTWNTDNILQFIRFGEVEAVYFTKLGNPAAINIRENTFEAHIRAIEDVCKNMAINTYRLHTPSGQGLGAGTPRLNKLINRWYNDNGGHRFPFLSGDFDINNYSFQ